MAFTEYGVCVVCILISTSTGDGRHELGAQPTAQACQARLATAAEAERAAAETVAAEWGHGATAGPAVRLSPCGLCDIAVCGYECYECTSPVVLCVRAFNVVASLLSAMSTQLVLYTVQHACV